LLALWIGFKMVTRITDMIDHTEKDKQRNVRKVECKIQELKSQGKSDDEIIEYVKGLNLPFDIHMAIINNYYSIINGNSITPGLSG